MKAWTRFLALGAALWLCAAPGPAGAADSLDRALGGFEPSGAAPAPPAESLPRPNEPAWRVGGSLETSAAWSLFSHTPPSAKLDYRGLTSLRGRAGLTLDGRLGAGWRARAEGHAWYDLAYAARGRRDFSSQMLSAMEEELELGRAYVQGPLAPGLELKLGRQVVVWGRSDLFGGLTPFNGHDQRDPGMYGPRDTLLPTAMARLSLAHAPWDLALVFQPEFRYDKLPPYGSDFYPFDFPPPAREEAGWGLGDAGWGLRLARDFTACSLALIGATYSRERDLVGLDRAGDQRPLDRLWLAGLSGDLAQGSLVFKLDSALTHGLTFYQLPGETKTRLDFTAGVDYAGMADTFLGLEATYRYLFGLGDDQDGRLDMPRRHTLALGLRVSRSFLRQKLTVDFTGYLIGLDGDNGGAQRLSLTYKPVDGLSLTGGMLIFQGGDNYLFQHIGDNDRLFLRLTYRF